MNKMLKSPCMKIIIDIRHSISLDVSLFSYFNRYVQCELASQGFGSQPGQCYFY